MHDFARSRSLYACWALILVWAAVAAGQVGITPAYVEVDLRTGRPAGRFIISNLGEREERFRVQAVHFQHSIDGSLRQSADGNHSLAPWVIFNPKELTLPPKSKRAVRFAIVPRGKLENGEYWGAMELESLRATDAMSTDANGRAVKIKVVATVMVPIFGSVGEVTYQGEVADVALSAVAGKPELAATVVNTGTGRLGAKGSYQLLAPGGEVVDEGKLGSAYVLRNEKRRFRRELDANLPAGDYVARLEYQAVHLEAPLRIEKRVTWAPPPPAEATSRPADGKAPAPAPVRHDGRDRAGTTPSGLQGREARHDVDPSKRPGEQTELAGRRDD